jgi:ribosomal protein S18 acetylase RimI-like enzyme
LALDPLQLGHAADVAHVHAEAMRGDFLPSLGERFLRILYRVALQRKVGFGWIWTEEEHVQGFVLGCMDTRAFFRKVLAAAAPQLAMAALPAVLRRPSLLGRVAETFAYPGREILPEVTAELLVIAVEEPARRRGIGQRLIWALNGTLQERGIGGYKVTVLESNRPANQFYQDHGFQLVGRFRLYKRGWNLYQYCLEPKRP